MKQIFISFFLLVSLSLSAQDVIIQPSIIDQQNVKIAVAYTGVVYSAFTTINNLENKGGMVILKSTDGGKTWSDFNSFEEEGIRYNGVALIAAGNDANTLKVFLSGIKQDLISGEYSVFINQYDASSGNLNNQVVNESTSSNEVYDIALASDYLIPSNKSNPYSIAFAYSKYGSPKDEIIYFVSTDGGNTFPTRETVTATSNFLNKISLAYGRSQSGSFGRYFIAYEERSSQTSSLGHIYSTHTNPQIDSPFIAPTCLDCLQSSVSNLVRNPAIACSYTYADNIDSGVTEVVLMDRAYGGDNTDFDIIGYYNTRAHYSNYFYRLDVLNNAFNVLQADVKFNMASSSFMTTYFDATNHELQYSTNDFNLTSPDNWNKILSRYNDANDLTNPFPQVEVDPTNNQAVFVWIADGINSNGVSMFDIQEQVTGIGNAFSEQIEGLVYPNPVYENEVVIRLNISDEKEIQYKISNEVGEIVLDGKASAINHEIKLFVNQSLSNGIYFITLSDISSNLKAVEKFCLNR